MGLLYKLYVGWMIVGDMVLIRDIGSRSWLPTITSYAAEWTYGRDLRGAIRPHRPIHRLWLYGSEYMYASQLPCMIICF